MKRTKITNTQQLLAAFLLIMWVCACIGGYTLKDFMRPLLVFEGICVAISLGITLIYINTVRKPVVTRTNHITKYLINGRVFGAIPSNGSCDGCHFVGMDHCHKEWCNAGKFIHVPM